MAENETLEHQGDADEKIEEEETDTSKNNDGAEEGNDEGADSDDNNDGDKSGDADDTEDDDKADDKKSKKSTSKEDDDEEPPIRKRPIDFIKERQAKKGNKSSDDKEKNDDTGDDDDDIDEADEKAIGKVVKKYLDPFIQDKVKTQDEAEISTFLAENPDLKPFEAKARKYMAHPSRKDVPIAEIFYGIAGKELLRIGANRAKIAKVESKKTVSLGGTQDAGGTKTAATMTRAELEAKQIEVRSKLADR